MSAGRIYRGLTLDRFQIEAIEALEADKSVLVCAPTGTGKTIIADWIVDQALASGGQVIYTAPIKALSNQKFRDYTRLYGEDRVGLVTGDLVIRRDAPCTVMTTEVLRNMLLAGEKLPHLRAVILDEIHFLDDRERGTVWEEVLIYLPKHVQIVGLSATLANLEDFAGWLEMVRERPIATIVETTRAVPLEIHYASVDTGVCTPAEYEVKWKRKGGGKQAPPSRGRDKGRDKGRSGKDRGGRRPARRTSPLDLFRMVQERDMFPFLYFVFSRRDTEILARKLGEEVGSLLSEDEEHQVRKILRAQAGELGPALDPDLRELYASGIAYHHAGLHVRLKTLVEELYEAKLIKALYCTSTFALGINLPARAVVFDGLKKYDGRGFAPLTVRQFMQKAGRAGRRGMDTVGHVFLRVDLADFEEFKPNLKKYAENRVEPVRSSFNLSWNSVVNLLDTYEPERCREIVEKSFLNWWREKTASTDVPGDRFAQRMQRRAQKKVGQCWEEFQSKIEFLTGIGYLDEDQNFNAGARVLANLQISEILMCELVLEGVLEGLSDEMLFGLCCAVTNELPRHAKPNFRASRDDKDLGGRMAKIRFSPVVVDAEAITEESYAFDRNLITVGRAWASGKSLTEIGLMVQSDTDIQGDLINGFRRAKDLLKQLVEVYAEDPEHAASIRALIKRVSRDEVEVVG